MTKKRMDDTLCVRFPVTPKSCKSCTHSYWLHFVSYKTLTCLLNTCFVMKNKVLSCVINVVIHCNKVRHAVLCNTAKTVHITWKQSCLILYSNKNILSFSSRNEQHLVEIVMSNIFVTSFAVCLKKA